MKNKTLLNRFLKWNKILQEIVDDTAEINKKIQFLHDEFSIMYAAVKEIQDDKD